MPDFVSRKRLKKKVVDRWENEGGRLCDDKPGMIGSPDKRPGEGNSNIRTAGGRAAKKEENKEALYEH